MAIVLTMFDLANLCHGCKAHMFMDLKDIVDSIDLVLGHPIWPNQQIL